jgi:ABC-type phosphate transport system permease subunit
VGIRDELPVTSRQPGRYLARADRQHFRHPADGRHRGTDRRRGRHLSRGIRQPQPVRAPDRNQHHQSCGRTVIYGLLGLSLFVRMLALGRSVLAGAATLALLVLPVVILSTREALRAVPKSIREGSYALGATQWQTIWHQVLPVAFPGILTGLILALSRAIGETAPLITIGAVTFVTFVPDSVWSPFTVLPIQIFNWVSRPQSEFQTNAAAGILVLLALLLTMNAAAIWLRDRYQRKGAA